VSIKIPQRYFEAAQQLTNKYLKEDFSATSLTSQEIRKIQTLATEQKFQSHQGQVSGSAITSNTAAGTISKHKEHYQQENAKNEERQLQAALSDFKRFEDQMANKYGDDFALQWATDLLNPGDALAIAEIDDTEIQRRETWRAFDKALQNGEIHENQLNADQKRFLEDGRIRYAVGENEVKLVQQNLLSANEISSLGKELGKDATLENAPDIRGKFETATIAEQASNKEIKNQNEIELNFDLGMRRD